MNASVMLFHYSHVVQSSRKSEQRTRCQVGREVKAGAISASVLHQKLCNEVIANDGNIGPHRHPQSCTHVTLHMTSVASESPQSAIAGLVSFMNQAPQKFTSCTGYFLLKKHPLVQMAMQTEVTTCCLDRDPRSAQITYSPHEQQ